MGLGFFFSIALLLTTATAVLACRLAWCSRFRFSKSLFVSDGGVGVQFRSEFFICLLKADLLNYF